MYNTWLQIAAIAESSSSRAITYMMDKSLLNAKQRYEYNASLLKLVTSITHEPAGARKLSTTPTASPCPSSS